MMKQKRKLFAALTDPFRSGNELNIGLMLVYLTINGLVLANACLHDPRIGYDAGGHLSYIQTLSRLRLVTPQDSREFFSPPLPYTIPALLMTFTGMKLFWAAKLAQCMNVLLSLGLTLYLIKTCQLLSSRSSLKLGTLVFLGILPVYYKTFAFVQGEPYVVFFTVIILYYALLMFIRKQFSTANSLTLGASMGLCALSRQWGILLFPSIFLMFAFQWARLPRWRHSIVKASCLCLILIVAIGGWFYVSLYSRYGSITAFNRKPAAQVSLGNQPLEFYFGLSPDLLFSKPLYPSFPNQFLPIFYSELWGDYWGYFIAYGRDTRTSWFINGPSLDRLLSKGSPPSWLDTNYETIGAYLGRVNFVSIFPSALALISFIMGAAGILRGHGDNTSIAHQKEVYVFFLLTIGVTVAGYFWFLITYPSIGVGDTIKATYMLHIFPIVAMMVGIFLGRVREGSPFLYRLILGGLCLGFAHNIFAMLTHYSLHHLL